MMQALLRHAVPLPRPADFDSFLFIGPHPDDIETGAAPTVRALTGRGKRVSFLIITDGGAGSSDPEADVPALIRTRQREARDAAHLLGVHDITFLGLPDGGPYSEETCAAEILRTLLRVRPDAIFAPDPDVRSECHPDHLKAGRAAKSAALLGGYPLVARQWGLDGAHSVQALFLYYTDRPNCFVNVTNTYAFREAALRIHESQYPPELLRTVLRYFSLRSTLFGIGRLCGKCDGYRALAPMHMHCCPESARW